MFTRGAIRYTQKVGGTGTNRQRERIIQVAVARHLNQRHPGVDFYIDWSSGAYLTAGQNTQRLRLSSKNKWVDIFIAEPRHGYHGYFIEAKREDVRIYLKDGKTLRKDPQMRQEMEFIERQRNKGYKGDIISGLDDIITAIDAYLDGDHPVEQELPF